MGKTTKILVVDDELAVLESFKMILEIKDYYVKTALSLDESTDIARNEKFNLAFVDLRFNGKEEGLQILKGLKTIDPSLEIIIVTAFASDKTKMEAKKLGAFDYINKPFMMEDIYQIVDRVLAKQKK